MALFMVNEKITVCVQATEISHNDGYILAWFGEDIVAMFRESEIIGCWLDDTPKEREK